MDLNDISPGVRDLVEDMQRRGYTTTDSGDGSNLADGMECALPMRHVFGLVPNNETMRAFAKRLQHDYPVAHVEVTFSPGEPALFCMFPDGPMSMGVSGADDVHEICVDCEKHANGICAEDEAQIAECMACGLRPRDLGRTGHRLQVLRDYGSGAVRTRIHQLRRAPKGVEGLAQREEGHKTCGGKKTTEKHGP